MCFDGLVMSVMSTRVGDGACWYRFSLQIRHVNDTKHGYALWYNMKWVKFEI